MFPRIVDAKLDRWAASPKRLPLILRGARQVGKTASIRELARRHFGALVEVNFERDPRLGRVFDEDLDPKRVVATLEALYGEKIVAGETLLFLDEVQDCPKALTALRYFAEEMPALHVMAAGSLLEFALGEASIPVGRVQFVTMRPMCLSEFLVATKRETLVPHLPRLDQLGKQAAASPLVSGRIRGAMREYWLVGGMPAAVAAYAEQKSFAAAAEVQSALLEAFRNDIHKYARGDKLAGSIGELFGRVLAHVGKQITYSKLGDGDDVKRTKKALEKLARALLVTPVPSVNPMGLPLGAEADTSRFKCIFLDIGLGQRAAGVPASEILSQDDLLAAYSGRLAEQFVGQQLLAESSQASEGDALYCWIRPAKSSSAEVDYVIVRDGKIRPLEVKGGASGRLKSLHLYLDTYQATATSGRGVCVRDVLEPTQDERIDFLPLFSVL